MIKKLILILGLFFALVLVRVFQTNLFYDPFLEYFKGDFFQNENYPDFASFKLGLSIFFRYLLNSVISLAIIYVAFKDRALLKFSIYLYLVAFIILFPIYLYQVENQFPFGYMSVFYIRRFLIQPLFVILLLPAFLYQKKVAK